MSSESDAVRFRSKGLFAAQLAAFKESPEWLSSSGPSLGLTDIQLRDIISTSNDEYKKYLNSGIDVRLTNFGLMWSPLSRISRLLSELETDMEKARHFENRENLGKIFTKVIKVCHSLGYNSDKVTTNKYGYKYKIAATVTSLFTTYELMIGRKYRINGDFREGMDKFHELLNIGARLWVYS